MSILVDNQIRERCVHLKGPRAGRPLDRPLLNPFSEGQSGGGIISWGLTHAGYDLRLGDRLKLFRSDFENPVSAKKFGDEQYQRLVFHDMLPETRGKDCYFVIPRGGYALAVSMERFWMPPDLKGRVVGKSTNARGGIIVNCTPIEPGWKGFLTIELHNGLPCPVELYVGEGIAQVEFDTLAGVPDKDYAGKDGQYHEQEERPVPPRVKR